MSRLLWLSFVAAATIASGLPFGRWTRDLVSQTGAQSNNQMDRSCSDEKNFSHCFKLLSIAHGHTPDGVSYSQLAWRGPDGEKVQAWIFHYDSTELAKKQFDARVKSAKNVLDRATTLNYGGQAGEMALLEQEAVNYGDDEQTDRIRLVSAVGRYFRIVQSKSSQDVQIMSDKLKQEFASQKVDNDR